MGHNQRLTHVHVIAGVGLFRLGVNRHLRSHNNCLRDDFFTRKHSGSLISGSLMFKLLCVQSPLHHVLLSPALQC